MPYALFAGLYAARAYVPRGIWIPLGVIFLVCPVAGALIARRRSRPLHEFGVALAVSGPFALFAPFVLLVAGALALSIGWFALLVPLAWLAMVAGFSVMVLGLEREMAEDVSGEPPQGEDQPG